MGRSINGRALDTELSGIRQISNLIPEYPGAINLTVGQPDTPVPEGVKAAGERAIRGDLTGYSHNAGLPELRKIASAYYGGKYRFEYDPYTETVVTAGASGAMDAVLRTLLEPGDEVIIPVPIFAGYEPLIKLAGAKPVYLDTRPTGFVPDVEQLESLITEKTKIVIFNNPSNPTGVMIPQDQMDSLAEMLARHPVFILSDDIYSENTYGVSHTSFGKYPALRDRLFLIHGLSKSHSMTGWRIGFLFGPADIMNYVVRIHAYNTICAPTPSQHAAIEALGGSATAPDKMNEINLERRSIVLDALHRMQLPTVKPNGAFYAFPSIQEFPLISKDFALRMLAEAGVAVVHGSAFTDYGEGYIRISYARPKAEVRLAMERMSEFVEQLRRNR
ncbi:aminotransferase class I/II-fold pyridoxal phosphate-dependent enzyme [Edaphobacillus lindanitolerans]|uniref:Aminotransferase n=1 Tax=Edaphobacillus lindanitolerans TaxID=550447 RepID=A0A1U7PJM7_9BACI|nr:aminotransferase class I/II-fold pyridoxal phosphate-dependent enzyme [Edaphobacillus lindanitolerans]SIT69272.1 aminotransferase [Edaphobacillus lindanitolerans]